MCMHPGLASPPPAPPPPRPGLPRVPHPSLTPGMVPCPAAQMGVMAQVRYLSTMSGSSWFNAPYSYTQVSAGHPTMHAPTPASCLMSKSHCQQGATLTPRPWAPTPRSLLLPVAPANLLPPLRGTQKLDPGEAGGRPHAGQLGPCRQPAWQQRGARHARQHL